MQQLARERGTTLSKSFNCRFFNLLNSFGLYNKNAKILFLVSH